jgi:hypothetical protein
MMRFLRTGSIAVPMTPIYEVRPPRDYRGVDLISDALPSGSLCYGEPNAAANAIACLVRRRLSFM